MWSPAVVKAEWEMKPFPTQLQMMSGVPFETCSAFNEWWNNKFY
jgi:hypothetical protein